MCQKKQYKILKSWIREEKEQVLKQANFPIKSFLI